MWEVNKSVDFESCIPDHFVFLLSIEYVRRGGLRPTRTSNFRFLLDRINSEDLLMQKLIFVDIVGASFQYRRSVKRTQSQFAQAGFSDFKISPDTRGMFVTIVAQK